MRIYLGFQWIHYFALIYSNVIHIEVQARLLTVIKPDPKGINADARL